MQLLFDGCNRKVERHGRADFRLYRNVAFAPIEPKAPLISLKDQFDVRATSAQEEIVNGRFTNLFAKKAKTVCGRLEPMIAFGSYSARR